jgi:hypothetical protein
MVARQGQPLSQEPEKAVEPSPTAFVRRGKPQWLIFAVSLYTKRESKASQKTARKPAFAFLYSGGSVVPRRSNPPILDSKRPKNDAFWYNWAGNGFDSPTPDELGCP